MAHPMSWTAGACTGCEFRVPYAIVHAWHKDGRVFDLTMCGECLLDWLQDLLLDEQSLNPVTECKWTLL